MCHFFTCEIVDKFAVYILEPLVTRTLHAVYLPLAEAEAEQGGHGETLEARPEDPEVAVGLGVIQRLLPREASDRGGLGPRVREGGQVEDVHGGQGNQSPHSEVLAHSQTAQLGNILQTRHLQRT